VLLVTPNVPVVTAEAFAALAAGGSAAPAAPGATRISSVHLAGELLGGQLRASDLVTRAGILSTANDLLPATTTVVPDLLPLRRALVRLLGRPVGLSGSGPTLWALYASEAEATAAADLVGSALADGRLAAPGHGPPFVAATIIVSRPAAEEPSA